MFASFIDKGNKDTNIKMNSSYPTYITFSLRLHFIYRLTLLVFIRDNYPNSKTNKLFL